MPYIDGLPSADSVSADDMIVVDQGGTGTPGSAVTRSARVSQLPVSSYTLPTASTAVLGGVRVDGTTVTIDDDGVISAEGGDVTLTGPAITDALTSTPAVQQTAFGALGALGTLTSSSAPLFQISFSESFTMGSNFYDAVVVEQTRTGGTGHRQVFTAQITSSGGNVNENLVGSCGFAFLTGGSGVAFGMNGYAQAMPGTASTAKVIGAEMNTDARTAITDKVGLQVVDVATSTSDGSSRSAGVYIARQGGGVGWQAAIQFGDSSAPASMTPSNINLLYLAGASASVGLHRGIDFRAGVFSLPAIDLPPTASIAFGGGASGNLGAGGTVLSATSTSGPTLSFGEGSLNVNNATNSTTAFSINTSDAETPQIFCNAPVLVGSPAGGLKGVGSINAATLYNNGVPVVGAQSLTGAGYCTLPGGMIMQWALVTTPSTGLYTWTFPIPFPAAALNVQATNANSVINQAAASASVVNTSSATIALTNVAGTGGGVSGQVYVTAIGH